MAKTAKVKKRRTSPPPTPPSPNLHTNTPLAVTIHSRAARRAHSPSLNLSKADQKPAQTVRSSTSPSRSSKLNTHALAAKDAGIQKKQKKGTMTRAQRLRYQKGLERAEENMEKLEKKREKSSGREKVIKERAKGWEDVNVSAEAGKNVEGGKKVRKEAVIDQVAAEKRKEREWVSDDDMDDEEVGAPEVKGESESKGEDAVVPESGPVPVEQDEML
jgi:hypothetical protein